MLHHAINLIVLAAIVILSTVVSYETWAEEARESTSSSRPGVKTTSESHESVPEESGRSDSLLASPVDQKTDTSQIQEQIISIIGKEDHIGICQYYFVTTRLDKTSLPVLCELLSDDAYKNRWGQIASMIAWLSEPNDVVAANAILAYIRRPDIWTRKEVPYPFNPYYQKISALKYLGLFRTPSVIQALRDAFTQAGAEDLVESWLDKQGEIGREVGHIQIVDVRGFAAMGLMLTREEGNIQLVRGAYENFAHKTQTGEFGLAKSEELELQDRAFFDQLVIAMADDGIIRDVGFYENLRTTETQEGDEYLHHLDRFSGSDLISFTSRIFVDPCPICGRTSKPAQ